jgi:hypothetical protein
VSGGYLNQPLGKLVVKVEAADGFGLGCAGSKDTVALRVLVPDFRGESTSGNLKARAASRYTASRSAIPSNQWPSIVVSVQVSGLRTTARMFGVSHEAIRQLVRTLGRETNGTDRNVERDEQIRELALVGVSWSELADRFGLSPSGVRYLCRDLPARQKRQKSI